MSTVAATTKEIKTSTKYTYDYTHLPPLAMVRAVTDAEAFSARPEWIRLAARPALKILINSIMIGVKDKGDKVEFVQQVLKKIQAIAQQLKGDAGRDLSNTVASELDKQGSPTTLPRLKALLEGVIEPLAQTLPLNTLLEIAQINSQLGTVSGPASSLEDYNQVFQFISLPAVSENLREDSEFAAMRVAGPNPVTIERAELVELFTLICFTASAQHAAVNFPQASLMSYVPAAPPAGYSPLSLMQEGFSEDDFLRFLPPMDIAKSLLDILYLLSSVYYTRLGDYGNNYFTDPAIQNHLAKFQQELIKIEEEINERNKTRTPYEFLLPSKIPQSINI